MPQAAAIVELHHIAANREQTRVFEDLTLSLHAGENVAIIGPNGAGKSTLLKLMTREIYPLHREQSRMTLFGQDRWDILELRQHLGMVSQDLQDDYEPDAHGLEIILSGLYASIGIHAHQSYSEDDVARARELMDLIGIAALEHVPYARMSTGQQRRCLLGRALIHEPGVLVLDEPTSGLDLTATFQYLALMRSLMAAGKTLVLVTHHIHEIPPEIGRVILLRQGSILADGPKRDTLTAANLRELFGTPVALLESGGWYQAVPGDA
ncbi:MAG TPA: ATP-binding cassette domain-containing protein [Mariprofundaceae bacterium]|nr:ATP-binding cassette domain-containing protein [Mariprofundaceae bacterium]